MEEIIIHGGRKLEGRLPLQGSKNSSLPILAACVLANGVSVLHNIPALTDVAAAVRILEHLGCSVTRQGHTLTVDSRAVSCYTIPEHMMHEMRSSIVFLGAMLARLGKAELCTPGGCEIGLRPIDLHLSSLRALGAEIEEQNACLHCACKEKLRGCVISLSFPSVGATENIMLAAAAATGSTTILNAAREPEIDDLAAFLNACGGKVHICAGGAIQIEGVKKLHGAEHTVISDRIAALTYMAATAACGGDVLLEQVQTAHFLSVNRVFEQAGCQISATPDSLRIRAPKRLLAVRDIRTLPYPGFPTDAQAAVMAMLSKADGTSVMVETIFENRFHHVHELNRMGARIRVEGRVAIIDGVPHLTGAPVTAVDLRAGGALVVAGLAAAGTTQISGVHHIDRGYERIEACLRALCADIERSAERAGRQQQLQPPVRK